MTGIRKCGILMHLTSLPSPFGIGDLGSDAYRFADLLAQTGQQYWQILPAAPTDPEYDHSPYHGLSAFAGDPLWISPQMLVNDGWLLTRDLDERPDFPGDRTVFSKVRPFKKKLLKKAFARFESSSSKDGVAAFARRTSWLADFAMFRVLSRRYGRPWCDWPEPFRDRQPGALKELQQRFAVELKREVFFQYLFFRQWFALKRYCNRRGIWVVGDMPIYVPLHSADVWSCPQLFKLDSDKRPTVVSGVPPDYFSSSGQLWGHPVYDWTALSKNGFGWWVQRTAHNLQMFDRVRVDHFRGWVGCWEVPAASETAAAGRWVPVPGNRLLALLSRRLSHLSLIAEDLGTITADVREVMARYNLPGMRVLQFAFGADFPGSAFLPHNHVRNCVVYTGTHDNNTICGWFAVEAGERERNHLARYLGRTPEEKEIHWDLIRMALASVAQTAVIPMQDLLGLEASARMNRPASTAGNWRWRITPKQFSALPADRLLELTRIYGRAG